MKSFKPLSKRNGSWFCFLFAISNQILYFALYSTFIFLFYNPLKLNGCYDIKPVRKEEGKSYWKIPLCDDDATREK